MPPRPRGNRGQVLLERNDADRLDLELGALRVARLEQKVPYRADLDRGADLPEGVT